MDFLKDQEFVSKTINDHSIDLDKFPTSKVRQYAKKMGASKATAQHIQQVASDSQVAQINLMRHQWTDLPPSKHRRKLSSQDHPVTSIVSVNNKCQHTKESLILNKLIQAKKGVLSVVIPDMLNSSV